MALSAPLRSHIVPLYKHALVINVIREIDAFLSYYSAMCSTRSNLPLVAVTFRKQRFMRARQENS
jgi:hypothetical protein